MASTGKRFLFGCAIGCVAVLVLGIASCVGFFVWLNRPGDVLEPDRLLGADTTGYVEWTLRLEDPGTREFMDLMLRTLQDVREGMTSVLPPAVSDRLIAMQNRKDERKLRRLFPVVLAWTVRPGDAADTDLHLLSVSLRGVDHQLVFLDWILGFVLKRSEEVGVVKHRGEKIYSLPVDEREEAVALFIHRGDFFLTSDIETAQQAIDRLVAPVHPTTSASSLKRWFALAPTQALRGALANERGEVRRIWRAFLDSGVDDVVDESVWSALEGVTIGGEFTAEGSLVAAAEFHFADPGQAAGAAVLLQEAVERAIRGTPIDIAETSVRDRRFHVVLEVSEIPERLESMTNDDLPGQ